jgi:hypothetical protein
VRKRGGESDGVADGDRQIAIFPADGTFPGREPAFGFRACVGAAALVLQRRSKVEGEEVRRAVREQQIRVLGMKRLDLVREDRTDVRFVFLS